MTHRYLLWVEGDGRSRAPNALREDHSGFQVDRGPRSEEEVLAKGALHHGVTRVVPFGTNARRRVGKAPLGVAFSLQDHERGPQCLADVKLSRLGL